MGAFTPVSFLGLMEVIWNRMLKKYLAFAMFTLILSAVLSGTAGAEEREAATPTDLTCPHTHTDTTIYFFDSPSYQPVDEQTHRVSGPANVETVCVDCGEVLSFETVDNIEEIRSHSMKNGVCALCGFSHTIRPEAESAPAAVSVSDTEEERTVYALQDMSVRDLETLKISNAELAEIKESGASTILVRGNSGSMAVALEVADVLAQAEMSDADLYLELAEREDNSVFAGLYLISASGERRELAGSGITLRFYQENRPGVRVSVAPADSDEMTETQIVWDGRGYWSIQYLEEGTYFILQ